MNVFGNNNVPSLLSEGVKRLERQAAAAAKAEKKATNYPQLFKSYADAAVAKKKLTRKRAEGAARNTPKKIRQAHRTHTSFKKMGVGGDKEYEARMALARKGGLGVGDNLQTVANKTMSPEEQKKMVAQRKEWKGKLKKPGKQKTAEKKPASDLFTNTFFQGKKPNFVHSVKPKGKPKAKPKEELKDHQKYPSLLAHMEENRSRKTAKKRLSDMRPLTSKAKGALKKHLRKNPGQIDSLAMKHGSENLGRIYNPDSEK